MRSVVLGNFRFSDIHNLWSIREIEWYRKDSLGVLVSSSFAFRGEGVYNLAASPEGSRVILLSRK